jgi:tetratricopeptide (TPR) repeat protein
MALNNKLISGAIGAGAAIAILAGLRLTVFAPDAPKKTEEKPAAPAARPAPKTRPGDIVPLTRPAPQTRPAPLPETRPVVFWEIDRGSPLPASRPATRPAQVGPDTLAKAGKAFEDERYDAAIELYRRAVSESPGDLDALRGLAASLRAAGKYEQTIPILKKILEIARDDRVERHNLALAYARGGDFFEAEREYRRLLDKYPDFTEARANLAIIYQVTGKLQYAREQWEKILMKHPDLYGANFSLGEIFMKTNDYKAAMERFSKASQLRPDSAAAWLNFGIAAMKMGFNGRAAIALRRAQDTGGLEPDGLELLGDRLLDLHRSTDERQLLERAVRAWDKACKLDPERKKLKERVNQYRAILSGVGSRPEPTPETRPGPSHSPR